MEEKKTIWGYLGQIFAVYGVIVTIFIGIGMVFGEGASENSSLFQLGSAGFSLDTLLQLLGLAVLLVVLQILFLTDAVIKHMPMLVRTLCFLAADVVVTVIFISLFAWFPIEDKNAWISFFLSFGGCTLIGTGVSVLRERAENRKMEMALRRMMNGGNDEK